MPLLGKSLLDVSTLNPDDVFSLFKLAQKIRDNPSDRRLNRSVAMLFFEPSTRTRASFETAAHSIGLNVLNLDPSKSSVVKGESLEDTVLTIQAMGVALLVIRHKEAGVPYQLSKILSTPIINGGDGAHEHPTQALLDAFTIFESRGGFKGEKVVIAGDILHSRVARSDIALLRKMGAEVALCGPSTIVPDLFKEWGLKIFRNIDEATEWATVVMLLRMQLERQTGFSLPSLEAYHKRFGITKERLERLGKDGIVMHPGPMNHGVEISSEALSDPRVRVLEQVKNGVFVRAALMAEILGVKL